MTVRLQPHLKNKLWQLRRKHERELARLIARLEEIEAKHAASPQFWTIGYVAEGTLQMGARLENGTQIFRVCATHRHCIALLVEDAGDLIVLDVCSRAEVALIEQELLAGL